MLNEICHGWGFLYVLYKGIERIGVIVQRTNMIFWKLRKTGAAGEGGENPFRYKVGKFRNAKNPNRHKHSNLENQHKDYKQSTDTPMKQRSNMLYIYIYIYIYMQIS